MNEGLLYRMLFRLRHKTFPLSMFRKFYWRMQGMFLGSSVSLKKLYVSWPHQVSIANNSTIEHDVYFHFDGIYSQGPSICIGANSFIGNGCEFNIRVGIDIAERALIAAGCRFVDHDHPVLRNECNSASDGIEKEIRIEENVWIGANSVVLKGVNIGANSVVAAGSVVNKSIPENEVWGGVPAKFIKEIS